MAVKRTPGARRRPTPWRVDPRSLPPWLRVEVSGSGRPLSALYYDVDLEVARDVRRSP